MSLARALKRPLSHSQDSARTQWETNKALGILDWNPTPAETEEYIQKRAAMGDKAMIALLEKREGKSTVEERVQARLKDIKENPTRHQHTFEGLSACCTLGGVLHTNLLEAHHRIVPQRNPGG